MALTTDRTSVLRGRPPMRAGGRRGFRTAHCWLVRSLGYGFGFIPFLRSRPPFGTDSECTNKANESDGLIIGATLNSLMESLAATCAGMGRSLFGEVEYEEAVRSRFNDIAKHFDEDEISLVNEILAK